MAAPWPSPREGLVPYSDVSTVTLTVGGINQPHPDSKTPSSPPLSLLHPPTFPLVPPLHTLLVNIAVCFMQPRLQFLPVFMAKTNGRIRAKKDFGMRGNVGGAVDGAAGDAQREEHGAASLFV